MRRRSPLLGGKKAVKQKGIAGKAAGGQGGDDGGHAGNGAYRVAGGAHGFHQPGAGVGYGGGAGIGYLHHDLAFRQPADDLFGHAAFVVFAQADQFVGVNAVCCQQAAGDAGVFGAHHIGHAKGSQRTRGNISQVSNGGGHHI